MAITSKFDFSGDETKARKLQGLAQIQLHKLRTFMKNGNLQQYSIILRDRNGTVIKASSVFGSEVVSVYVPTEKDIKLSKKTKIKTKLRMVQYDTESGHYLTCEPSGYFGLWDTTDPDSYGLRDYYPSLSGNVLSYVPFTDFDAYIPAQPTEVTVYGEPYYGEYDTGFHPTGGYLGITGPPEEIAGWWRRRREVRSYQINYTYFTNYPGLVPPQWGWSDTFAEEWIMLIGSATGTVYYSNYTTSEGQLGWGYFETPKPTLTINVSNSWKIGNIYAAEVVINGVETVIYSPGFPLPMSDHYDDYSFWIREDGLELIIMNPPSISMPYNLNTAFFTMPGAVLMTHSEVLSVPLSKMYDGVSYYPLPVSGSSFKYKDSKTRSTKVVPEGYKLQEGETLFEIEVEE